MTITDVVLFFCFLVSIWFFSAFLLKSFKNYRNSGTKVRHPPSPPALPFIGHLHLLGSVLGTSLHALAQRYGPFIQLRMGASICYVVSDAAIAKEVLKTNELNFVSRLQFDTTDYNIYADSGFITAPYNAYWRFMKKLCMTRLLNSTQLNQLAHIREDEIKKLTKTLINISNEGEPCDFRQQIMTTTNNIICRMSMSTRCLGDGANNEAREIKDLVLQVSLLGGKLSAGNVLGPLAKLDLFGHGRQLRIALEKFDQLVEKIIEEHEEKRLNGDERSGGMDLMDILLEISRDPNAEMKLTRKEIKAFFLDIMMAGTDTSSISVQWVLAELINHPKVFKKLRDEINSVVGTNRLVTYTDIPNLPYMQAVMRETLRLHPPSPIILRASIEDCQINGFDVKADTRMLVNCYTVHRDPNLWTDPLEFIPERFMVNGLNMNSLQQHMENFNYFPFGSGRRGCPGAPLALTVVQSIIGALVQCFDWKGKDGEKVDMLEGSGFSMGMAKPLVCHPITHINPFELGWI